MVESCQSLHMVSFGWSMYIWLLEYLANTTYGELWGAWGMIRVQWLRPGSLLLRCQWCGCTPGSWSLPAPHNHKEAFIQLRSSLSKGKPAQLSLVTLNNRGQAHHFPGLSMWPKQDFTGSPVQFWVFGAESNHFPLTLFPLPLLCQICVTSFSNSLFLKKKNFFYSGFCFLDWTLANTGTQKVSYLDSISTERSSPFSSKKSFAQKIQVKSGWWLWSSPPSIQ